MASCVQVRSPRPNARHRPKAGVERLTNDHISAAAHPANCHRGSGCSTIAAAMQKPGSTPGNN